MKRLIVLLSLLAGCNATTGSGLVSFKARIGGPADATGGSLSFKTGLGYLVTLNPQNAQFHVGAIYLNMSPGSTSHQEVPCIEPGVYVAQVFGACNAAGHDCGVDFNPLSSALVDFPIPGSGTANPAVEAEVWLTGGDINAADDTTPIFVISGTASRPQLAAPGETGAVTSFPFTAKVTIGSNRQVPVQNPATPGSNPICQQRIASPIPVSLQLADGGELDVRVDPRGMFDGVDFATLSTDSSGNYIIPDEPGGAGGNLLRGIKAISGVYSFDFKAP